MAFNHPEVIRGTKISPASTYLNYQISKGLVSQFLDSCDECFKYKLHCACFTLLKLNLMHSI